MSNELPKQSKSEEIDIVEIFNLIGRAIKSFFEFIFNVFKMLLDFLIILALFIKKNLRLLVFAAVFGFVLGIISDKFLNNQRYISTMIVEPNFNVSVPLVNNIQLYSELAQNNDSVALASMLKISQSEASKIVDVKIEPSVNENDQLKLFEKFIKEADTMMLRNVTFEDFKKNLTVYDYNRYFITLEAEKKSLFKSAEQKLLNISVPDFIKQIQQTELASIDSEERSLNMALQKIDSLRKDYRSVMIEKIDRANKPEGQNTNIYMGTENIRQTNELELFNLERRYMDGLENIHMEKTVKKEYVNVISGFRDIGIKKKDNNKYFYMLIFVGAAFLFLFLKEFNKFLTVQEKKLQKSA